MTGDGDALGGLSSCIVEIANCNLKRKQRLQIERHYWANPVEKETPIVPGKTIKSYQLRVYMNGREIGLTHVDAAYIAE